MGRGRLEVELCPLSREHSVYASLTLSRALFDWLLVTCSQHRYFVAAVIGTDGASILGKGGEKGQGRDC